ncbi:MAG: ATP-binding cassette domain-containing protein [Actinobacteria bacterium]|jgi:oligopeptide transport system ATP-binding protein|nr:ATP-binding cassette domain-containing protein [Actinomycetota bacterium]NCG38576.1 ATP-binding cassette domain-containing protein [Actinomycetota bacterium]
MSADVSADVKEAPATTDAPETLLAVTDLKKHFPIMKGIVRRRVGEVRAVDGITFDIHRGETLGLVGESGCGKSTTGRVILQLEKATNGSVNFQGQELTSMSGSALRKVRPHMQMVFQDPHASLNPRMTVASIIDEPLLEHNYGLKAERHAWIEELLLQVGLSPAHANRYPHEFSGGQRQRIGIARAIALNPDFIVCDEPIAALDVSIQAQVVNLLKKLQADLGLTYLFISHDLSMVRHLANRVAVMYLGKMVELAPVDELYDNPKHPYTQALHSAAPVPNPVVESMRERVVLQGDIPSPANPPSGCSFHTRCPVAKPECAQRTPEWREVSVGHWAACHFA